MAIEFVALTICSRIEKLFIIVIHIKAMLTDWPNYANA